MQTSTVTIVEYRPEWPAMAEAAIAEVRAVLGDTITAIEHMGSTSVPGLAAKPIIDLMAAASDLDAVAARTDALAAAGFERHHNTMADRLLYARGEDVMHRTHLLHIVEASTWEERNQRILRDHLRMHPEDVRRYAELKYAIVAAGTSMGDYAAAKTELIQELTDRARAERGLPSVPVWEKAAR